MMRKYLFIFLKLSVLGSLAFSCASEKTKKPPEEESISVEDVSEKAKPKAAVKVQEEPVQKNTEAQAPAASTLSQQLSEAIKNQKDQDIYRLSGQTLLDNPNDVKALNAMALYHYKKGRFAASEYLLRKALAVSPNSAEVHSNLGLIQLAQKQRREAILEFRKALEINPEDAVASANIGSIYIEEKDYTKAEVVLENVYRKGWKDPKVLINYAIALTANGKYTKAEEIYKNLSKDQISSREYLYNYAVLQIEHLKKYSEGLETVNRLKFIGPTDETRKKVAALEAKAKAGGK